MNSNDKPNGETIVKYARTTTPGGMSWAEMKEAAAAALGRKPWQMFLVFLPDGRVRVTTHNRRPVGCFDLDGTFTPWGDA